MHLHRMLIIGTALMGCGRGKDDSDGHSLPASVSLPAVLVGTGPDVPVPGPSRPDSGPNVLGVPPGYEVIGACSYVESLVCWDTSGNPNKELEALVAKTAEGASETGMYVTRGKKNRLVVTRRAADTGASEALQLEGARSAGALGWQDQERVGNVIVLGAAATPDAVELRGSTSTWEKQGDGAITLKVGAECRIRGLRLVFRGIKVSPAMSPPGMRRFELQFSVDGDASEAKVVVRPIGLNGKLVESIDDRGNPVDLRTWRPQRSTRGVSTHFMYAQGRATMKFDSAANQATVRIYVQPMKVLRLDLEFFSVIEKRTVRVPLDPK